MSTLTAARLRELLHYDRDTGIFTWRVNKCRVKAGDIAGTTSADGYRVIEIDGRKYAAHRLAWLYMTGEWPVDQIDHRDTDRANNRFENLREADSLLNMENMRHARKDNRLGVLGVYEKRGLFRAQIQVQGKPKHLGYYATPELAHAAYLSAKRIHHAGSTL